MTGYSQPVTKSTSQVDLQNVWVIIPARNEEESLPLVLNDLPDVEKVIVVNNGSIDQTAKVSIAAGAVVVDESIPGYGQACLSGMAYIEKSVKLGDEAPQVIVFLDGDYSDHPERLIDLIAPIFANQADFVLGSRLLGKREPGAMPPQSVYGNVLACTLMKWIWGAKYTDLGPFRAIGYQSLLDLKMTDTNFGWTVEMQVKAVVQGLRILEIPVPYRRRIGVSKISGTISGTFRAGTKILWTIAKYARQTPRKASNF